MKIVVLGLVLAAVALGGCRREEPYYEPMKLGGSVSSAEQAR